MAPTHSEPRYSLTGHTVHLTPSETAFWRADGLEMFSSHSGQIYGALVEMDWEGTWVPLRSTISHQAQSLIYLFFETSFRATP